MIMLMRDESMEVKFKHIKVKFLILLHYYFATRLEMFNSLKVLGMFDY